MAAPKWKTEQLWKKKPGKPATGNAWVDPGNPFGVGKPGGPPPLPANTGEILANGGTTPAAPAPAPPPRPTWTPPDYSRIPDDAASISGKTSAENAYTNAMNQIAAQRVAAGEDYGFDPATGRVVDNVDVTNPYSRAALMNRSFQQRDRGRRSSYANQGQMLSGAFASALAADAFDSAQQRKGLERDFLGKMLDFKGQENTADTTRSQALAQLQADLMSRRMAQDAGNSELVRSQLEAAQAAWDAQYGPKDAPAVPPAAVSSPVGKGPIGAPGHTWVNPGDPFGTSGSLPPNIGEIIAALAANPPKPKPKPKPGRKK